MHQNSKATKIRQQGIGARSSSGVDAQYLLMVDSIYGHRTVRRQAPFMPVPAWKKFKSNLTDTQWMASYIGITAIACSDHLRIWCAEFVATVTKRQPNALIPDQGIGVGSGMAGMMGWNGNSSLQLEGWTLTILTAFPDTSFRLAS